MKFLYAPLLLSLLTPSAMANALSDENAERVLLLLQTEQQHQERLTALDELNRRSFAEKTGRGNKLSADQKEEIETAVATASRIMRAELAWENIREGLIRITKASFDDKEADQILKVDPTSFDNALVLKISSVRTQYHAHMLGRIDAIGLRLDDEIDKDLRALRKSQLDGAGDPLSHLDGEWAITTIQFVDRQPKASGCGLLHQSIHMAYLPNERIDLSVQCHNGEKYSFKLSRDKDRLSYSWTVNSKEGINVESFPVKYAGSQGWSGSARQVIGGKETALIAAIVPIEGKTWYGWASLIRPADDSEAANPATASVLRVDFTRRK